MADEVMRFDCLRTRSALRLMTLSVWLLIVAVVPAQQPGEKPPAKIVSLASPALNEGRRTLEAEDAVAVKGSVAKEILLLGALAGFLNQAADETLDQGFSGTWADNFTRGLFWSVENKAWRDALNVNLNASGKNGTPTPGFAILPVLEGIYAKPVRER